MVKLNIKLCKFSNINSIYYGTSLITARNIPHTISVFRLGDYALCYPQYYDLPDIPVTDTAGLSHTEIFENIYNSVASVEYIYAQQNPNLLFTIGGDCQAKSIYLCKALSQAGFRNGLLPLTTHVCNWVILEEKLLKVDLITAEVVEMPFSNKLELFKVLPDLKIYK